MIMIWNQREVYIGNSMKQIKETRKILDSNKIKYKVKIMNGRTAHFFNVMALSVDLFGMKNDPSNVCYIYVHKKDFNRAWALVN